MKINLFGLDSNTIGQNVMRYIHGCEQPIGIMEYNYPEMKRILSKAMTPYEYHLISLGYGIDCQRIKQKEIAVKLGISEAEVSKIGHEAMDKVKASPYKVQLEKLMLTVQEISRYIGELNDSLEAEKTDSKVLKETSYRLQAAEMKLAESEKARKLLEKEKAYLTHDNNRLEKELEASKAKLEITYDKANELNARLRHEKAFSDSIINAFYGTLESLETQMETAMQRARENLVGHSKNLKQFEDDLDSIGFSEEAKDAMVRASIKTLGTLCDLNPRSLRKMIGAKLAAEVASKLEKADLHLKKG